MSFTASDLISCEFSACREACESVKSLIYWSCVWSISLSQIMAILIAKISAWKTVDSDGSLFDPVVSSLLPLYIANPDPECWSVLLPSV